MKINTHEKIDQELCGTPISIEEGICTIKLLMTGRMKVDESGLIHGGFTFGLADYAAMIAVNHPNVVLGGSNVKFLKPLKVGDVIIAEAKVILKEGKKRKVQVVVKKGDDTIFEGEFICFVLDKHILQ